MSDEHDPQVCPRSMELLGREQPCWFDLDGVCVFDVDWLCVRCGARMTEHADTNEAKCTCKCGHVAPGPWHSFSRRCPMYAGALDLPVPDADRPICDEHTDTNARADAEADAVERIAAWLERPLTGSAEFIEDNRRNRHDFADAIRRGDWKQGPNTHATSREHDRSMTEHDDEQP